MLIVLEGSDAVGKATQSKMLAEKLGAARFAFPNYQSPTGELILSHLKKEWFCAEDESDSESAQHYRPTSDLLDARVFQSLQTVNRLESLPAIREAAQKGHVVFDRYYQSAIVYGSLDGLDEAWLRLVQESPMPPADINILIDVPVEEGFKRRPERRDRYEQNREFLERVRTKYLELWRGDEALSPRLTYVLSSRPGWYVVTNPGSAEDVHQTILEIVAKTQTGVL